MINTHSHDSPTPLEILNTTESEALQIKAGLEFCDESPWQWGNYMERYNEDEDIWYPCVYGDRTTFEEARQQWLADCHITTLFPQRYRNPRIVRRAVSPWEEKTEP